MSNYAEVRQQDPEALYNIGSEFSLDSINNLKDQTACQRCQLQKTRLGRKRLVIHILLALCLFFSICFIYLQFRQPTEQEAKRKDRDCIRRVSSYTPALEAIEYYETNFDYSMNQFRDPSIENKEKAWLGLFPLGHQEGIMIKSVDMPMLNHTNFEEFEKVQPEEGNGYFALLELHIQLDCLTNGMSQCLQNIVRQYIELLTGGYSEDRIPDNLSHPPEDNRMHVNYCIEHLRQNIMCQGDVTPILVTKGRFRESGSKLDTTTHHKCRNITKIQEWAKSHGIDSEAARDE